jgi:hypothetical protein
MNGTGSVALPQHKLGDKIVETEIDVSEINNNKQTKSIPTKYGTIRI